MRENLPVHPSVHADLKTLPALVSSDSVVPIFCRWLYRHLQTLCVAHPPKVVARRPEALARSRRSEVRGQQSEAAPHEVSLCWVPFLDFQTFDSLELSGVTGDEGGFQAAGLGSDEEIQRSNDFACRF